MLNKLILFEEEDKDYILLESENNIDYGIEDLCNVINSVDCFVTMNSCQGSLHEEEKDNHCPKTYVDFYVLNHEYDIANNLFIALISEFGECLNCTLNFRPDFDMIDDYTEENGCVNLRYSIEFVNVNNWIEDSVVTIKKVVEFIKKYNIEHILGDK